MPFDKKKIEALTPEAKAALEAALKGVDLQISEIEETHTKAETEAAARTKAEAELEAQKENWKTAYEEYGKVVGDLDATVKEKQAAEKKLQEAESKRVESERKLAEALSKTNIDTTTLVTKEELAKSQKALGQGMTAYMGDALDAVAEIERLTKTRVSPKSLVQEAMAAGKPPLEFAEEKYKISEKKVEIEKAERQKEIDDAVRKGREQAISEMANPATRTMEDSRDPFYIPKGDKPANPWDEGVEDPLELRLKAASPDEFDAVFTKAVKIKQD